MEEANADEWKSKQAEIFCDDVLYKGVKFNHDEPSIASAAAES